MDKGWHNGILTVDAGLDIDIKHIFGAIWVHLLLTVYWLFKLGHIKITSLFKFAYI